MEYTKQICHENCIQQLTTFESDLTHQSNWLNNKSYTTMYFKCAAISHSKPVVTPDQAGL